MHGAADIRKIVEYSRDRWNMERVPLALLACLVGMFFVVYVDPRPPGSAILRAFITLVAISIIALLTQFLLEQISEGSAAVRFLAGAIIILAAIALYWNTPGDLFRPRRMSRAPASIIGWIFVMGASAGSPSPSTGTSSPHGPS
jgi:hypothetical protein